MNLLVASSSGAIPEQAETLNVAGGEKEFFWLDVCERALAAVFTLLEIAPLLTPTETVMEHDGESTRRCHPPPPPTSPRTIEGCCHG